MGQIMTNDNPYRPPPPNDPVPRFLVFETLVVRVDKIISIHREDNTVVLTLEIGDHSERRVLYNTTVLDVVRKLNLA